MNFTLISLKVKVFSSTIWLAVECKEAESALTRPSAKAIRGAGVCL